MIGTTILHYEILELLGRGAMGTVYKALDTRLDTFRALKFLQPDILNVETAGDHLHREARTQAKLFHPNVAALLELQIVEDQTFLVLEYVDGPTLDVYLKESKPSLEKRFQLVLQVACALEAAHRLNILHRDIKPGNVLVTPEGIAKVTDFGLAKVLGHSTFSKSGGTKGTAPYMAPEAFKGERVDKTADVWSLGVMAYEVLEGEPPFMGDSFEAVAYRILHEPYPPLSNKVREALPGIPGFIEGCLSKDVEGRIENGSLAFSMLQQVATDAGVSYSVPVPTPIYRLKRKTVRLMQGIAAAALVAGAVLAGWLLKRPPSDLHYQESNPGWQALRRDRSPSWDPSGRNAALFTGALGSPTLTIWDTSFPLNQRVATISLDPDISLSEVEWSASDSILALTGSSGAFLYDLRTSRSGKLVPLLDEDYATDPDWSEDGSRLVYCAGWDSLHTQIRLEWVEPFGPDGDIREHPETHRLTVSGFEGFGESIQIADPTYILEDSHIAFIVMRLGQDIGIWAVPADGGSARLLVEGISDPSLLNWDPKSNALLVYSGENQDIYRVHLTRSGERKWETAQALNIGTSMGAFDYHHGSGRIVLISSSSRFRIWRIPLTAQGGPSEPLDTRYEANYSPVVSHDSARLYYSAYWPEFGIQPRVHDFASGSDEELPIVHPGISNVWLPATDPIGRYISFSAISEGISDLWIYDTVQPGLQKLTETPGNELSHVWSANGESIYYIWEPSSPDLPRELRRLSFNRARGLIEPTGESETLMRAESISYPVVDEDERLVLYRQFIDGQRSLFIRNLETGDDHFLVFGDCPVLDPSGQDVYYLQDRCIYVLRNWTDISTEEVITGELVRALPQGLGTFFQRPMAISTDAAYIILWEQDVGWVKVLSPGKR